METKYIKVSLAERLPKENKKYPVGLKGKVGLNWLMHVNGKFYNLIGKSNEVEYWLDEIPDREEEMREMLEELVTHHFDFMGCGEIKELQKKAEQLLSELQNKP